MKAFHARSARMASTASDALVVFGASGDLAFKKIFPALLHLVRDGWSGPILGVALSDWDDAALRQRARESLDADTHATGADQADVKRLLELLRYVRGDYRDAATFTRLKQRLNGAQHPLYYLAIPPALFGEVARHLHDSGGSEGARIVVEKPFGRDLASARALNLLLHEVFDEEAIFRIDHYLGKEAVQNLVYFRFANTFLEPVWNRHYVDRVEITMAEAFGVEDRGAFYDSVGALRDVVQNHLMQVVTLLAMETPVGQDPGALDAEKLRLLRAVRPIDPAEAVRGQVQGYRDIAGVAAGSTVETYVALRLHIDTWRWAGVPFYVRAGKNLPLTATEVLVDLKPPPVAIFDDIAPSQSDYFRFRLTPQTVLAAGARIKRPGDGMRGEPVELVAQRRAATETPPYARLLGDALRGDKTLFTSDACVEAAWAVVEPLVAAPPALHAYSAGSWGPAAARDLVRGSEDWHDPQP
jgi:glucose-6-phosphate 1-dehydrogenase